MARPPQTSKFSLDDYRSVSDEQRQVLVRLFEGLNSFQTDVAGALNRRLTLTENTACLITKPVTATAPDWTAPTLLNSWVNYDTSLYNSAGYWCDDRGFVYLRGVVKDGTGIPTTVFTLPAGYRPTREYIFATTSNGAYGRLHVTAAGAVSASFGNVASFVLDGACFAVSGAPPAWSGAGWPLTLQADFAQPVRAVLLVSAVDTSGTQVTSVGAAGVDWSKAANNQVYVRRVAGLTPGRRYELTFLLVGG